MVLVYAGTFFFLKKCNFLFLFSSDSDPINEFWNIAAAADAPPSNDQSRNYESAPQRPGDGLRNFNPGIRGIT